MGILGKDSQEKPPAGQRPAQQIQVELPEREAEGIYSNLVLMTHSSSEFIFDFARVLPGAPKAKVYARIIMTPQNAKSLLNALQKNLDGFEQKHGKIPGAAEFPPPREIGFK
ncbi:MAG: DUF3467 domain-containing protein [Candidatus Eisenbacteria bacterium]|nr:DUF3467 domain-containing protein [Candidatus Eisenbacteria bacterium]